MVQIPPPGTRVSLRYRLPAGAVPPHTDVVGHVLSGEPLIGVRTRRGQVVSVPADAVLAVRVVPEVPVRTGAIRNLEHAAALAWPGVEQEWQGGWLLRAGLGSTRRANSAVPLRFTSVGEIEAALRWYRARDLPALISAADRLFPVAPGVAATARNAVLTRDLADPPDPEPRLTITARPTPAWRAVPDRDIPDEVLTAVVDGEVAFADCAGVAVARAAVTAAPDGTRWVGLTSVFVDPGARRRGLARTVCAGLLSWAAGRGATAAYVQVLDGNDAAHALYAAMGFGLHHRTRYVRAEDVLAAG